MNWSILKETLVLGPIWSQPCKATNIWNFFTPITSLQKSAAAVSRKSSSSASFLTSIRCGSFCRLGTRTLDGKNFVTRLRICTNHVSILRWVPVLGRLNFCCQNSAASYSIYGDVTFTVLILILILIQKVPKLQISSYHLGSTWLTALGRRFSANVKKNSRRLLAPFLTKQTTASAKKTS